jgi:uncharacterized protein YhdP
MRLARIALAIVAVLVCAWFAIIARQAHDLAQAETIIYGSPTSAQAARASSLLSSAAWLNPNREVVLDRSALALDEHRAGQARDLALQVTRAEPLNILAWVAVIHAAAALGDFHLVLQATPHTHALEPLLPFH